MAEARLKLSGEMKQLQTSNPGVNYPEKPGNAIRTEGRKQESKDSLLGLKNSTGAPAEKNYQRRPEINRGFRVGKMMPTQKQSMELILMPQQT